MYLIKRRPFLLENGDIFLRFPDRSDYVNWVQVRRKNYHILKLYEPEGGFQNNSYLNFKRRIKWVKTGFKDHKVLSCLIFKKSSNELVGSITLESIMLHPFYSGSIGYWLDSDHYRSGYMYSALNSILHFVESKWGVTKINAATLPENTASIRLLIKSNFCQDGVLRRHLRVNGRWRDHLMFSYISDKRE